MRASQELQARWTYAEPAAPPDRPGDVGKSIPDHALGAPTTARGPRTTASITSLAWSAGLASVGSPRPAQIALLATLAGLRAALAGWDEPACALLEAAHQCIESNEKLSDSLLATLALLQVAAYLDHGDADDALATLETAADALREATDRQARARVVMRLGRTPPRARRRRAAAVRFVEAVRLLDALKARWRGDSPQTALARAYLSAGDRGAGVAELPPSLIAGRGRGAACRHRHRSPTVRLASTSVEPG